jgi:4-alpha-glucanotransferase
VPANDDGLADIRRRLVDATGLGEHASATDAVLAGHHALGRSPARMLCATLDDLMVVAERPNIPGAPSEHANWSTALPRPIETLRDDPVTVAVSSTLDQAVRRGASS